MKIKFIFVLIGLFIMASSVLFADLEGCIPTSQLATYPKVTTEAECNNLVNPPNNQMAPCWANGKCYNLGYPVECACLKASGELCTGYYGPNTMQNQLGYCRWGDTGADTWRFYWGEIAKPEKVNTIFQPEDLCRVLGGTVDGDMCNGYWNNNHSTSNCSLENLWDSSGKCNNILVDNQGNPVKGNH